MSPQVDTECEGLGATHHHACRCREEHFRAIEKENERLKALETELRQELGQRHTRIAKLEEALRLIAAPKGADGTYNRCREACEELARAALEGK